MKPCAALIVTVTLLAGCGGTARPTAASVCHGLATAAHSARFLTIFGAVNRFTRRSLCAEFGRPASVLVHGWRQEWRYGSVSFWLRGGAVIGASEETQTGTKNKDGYSVTEVVAVGHTG